MQHVAGLGKDVCIQDLGGKSTGKGPFARHRYRMGDKIKTDLNNTVWENINCINLTQDRTSSSCEHNFYIDTKYCAQ
jgi:hypothetical protein